MSEEPPVVEVAIQLTYERSSNFTLIQIADLYERGFRGGYPTVQQVPPLGDISVGPQTVQQAIQVISPADLPRLWFISQDTHDLVQVQDTRLVQNWRRADQIPGDRSYPGYESVRSRFVESWNTLERWLERHEASPLRLAIAELSYVNSIPMNHHGKDRRLSEVLAFYKATDTPIKVINFNSSWSERIEEIDGFVHVQVITQPLPDGQPAMALHLTARCPVQGLELETALQRVDIMHRDVSTVFKRALGPAFAASVES